MKLCVVSHKPVWRSAASPSGWATDGGTPLQIGALSSLFDHTDWIVCERSAPPGKSGNSLPSERLRVVTLPEPRGLDGPRKLYLAGTAGYYLARIAACAARADVVHAVVPGDIGMLGMLVALAMRKRLFVRYCGNWDNSEQTTRASRLCKQLMARYAGGRNVMLATGLGESPPDGPGGRMRWIYTSSFRAADLEALQRMTAERTFVPGVCRLLFTGRFSPEKGLSDLLEALARLVEGSELRVERRGSSPGLSTLNPQPSTNLGRYQLTLVGDGPLMGALREQAVALGLGDRVRFTGLLDFAGVCRELAAADLFVLPSLSEAWGNAMVEALAAGVPAVASDVGSLPVIVGRNEEHGLIVPRGNAGALAAAIGALAADPARREAMGERARLRVRGWTLEAWAETMGAILEEAWGLPLRSAPHVRQVTHVHPTSHL